VKPLSIWSVKAIAIDGRVVLDTSIALKWFLEDESDRAYSLEILNAITDDYRPTVPWLWYYEIANAILVQVRRKRVVLEKALVYLSIIDDMVIDIDPPNGSSILQLLHLARMHNLTVYDAAFLELAMRLGLPLATGDEALLRAALDAGVSIVRS
jgi:predicted nucleic acid-binding protein